MNQLLNKLITKQLHINPVIQVNTCIVAFICLSIQVMKHTIKSLPLQIHHLALKAIKQLIDQIIIISFNDLNIGRCYNV